MRTIVVNLQEQWGGDPALREQLSRISIGPDGHTPPIRIGIESPDGALYRVVEAANLMEAVRLCEVLRELGCVRSERRGPRSDPLHRVYRPGRI